jgi:DNA-binding NtrC family response regulator
MQDGKKFVVYVVDDEPTIARTLTQIVNNAGFHAIGFTDSNQALESAKSGAPGLLICDVIMPGLNGIELAIRFKSDNPECKTLLLSGHGATAELLELTNAQGHNFDCLAKPVHPLEMLEAIRSAVTGEGGRTAVDTPPAPPRQEMRLV